jgi:hypothetical protein
LSMWRMGASPHESRSATFKLTRGLLFAVEFQGSAGEWTLALPILAVIISQE